MNPDDKKKIGVIFLAVIAGIAASVLVGNYIKDSVQEQTSAIAKEYEKKRKQEMDSLRQEFDRFKMETAQAIAQQQQMAASLKDMQARGPGSAQPVAGPAAQSLAIKTPPGKRAITLDVPSLAAVGGMIGAGDFVDVLAHLNVPNPNDSASKDKVTVMVFQNVEILAVNTNLQQVPGQYPAQQTAPKLNVTFAVDPDEAGLLTFVKNNGDIQLVLRSPQETETRMLQAANWQTLSDYILEKQGTDISAPKSKALIEPAVEEVKPFIQIFRGGREL